MTHDTATEVAKASPVAATFFAWLAGMNLQDWALVATIIYTLLLIAEKLYKFGKERHDSRRKDAG